MTSRGAIALAVTPLALIGGGLFLWHSSDENLRKCEDEIRASLKAPSTYKRITVESTGKLYTIEYDAENSFGVPLRGRGMCLIDDHGAASWLELTK